MTGPRAAGVPGQPGVVLAGQQDPGPSGQQEPGRAGQPGACERAVVLSLGSNLGDRLANLQRGIAAVCGGGLRCQAVSGVFLTAPVGGPDQDDYLNAVLLATSSLSARDILSRCQAAESAAGRVRTVRWGPRTLDVDVITCGEEISSDPDLTLPHPHAHERAFVLAPWLEVQPQAVLPGKGPVAALLDSVGDGGVQRLPGLRLTLPVRAGEARLGGEADVRCT